MMPGKRKYYVYIVQCKDGTLYTGYTVDLSKRIYAHNSFEEQSIQEGERR